MHNNRLVTASSTFFVFSILVQTTQVAAQQYSDNSQSIAAISNESSIYQSGLFIGDLRDGYVRYYPSSKSGDGLDEPTSQFFLGRPTAIAQIEDELYAWDAERDSLVVLNLENGTYRILWRGAPFVEPSQIAVSPDRVVAIIDEAAGGLFWLETDPSRQIDFGIDGDSFSLDGQCADPRFEQRGSQPDDYADEALYRDATDCRNALMSGRATLPGGALPFGQLRDSDFGSDSGEWVGNGVCDDARFVGPRTSSMPNIGLDASDCRAQFEAGMASFRVGDYRYRYDGDFGNDSSAYALDGKCDDPRFEGSGTSFFPDDENVLRDATDCQRLFDLGQIDWRPEAAPAESRSLQMSQVLPAYQEAPNDGDIQFGDNSSIWAFDGECDDPRFFGSGAATFALEPDLGRDAEDCRTLFEAGEITLRNPSANIGASSIAAIDFGDDSSPWAFDDECDDPRFVGPGTNSILLDSDLGHDAADCRSLYLTGAVSLPGELTIKSEARSTLDTEVTSIGKLPLQLDAVSAAFLAWDRLAVVDRNTDSVVSIDFVVADGYFEVFDASSRALDIASTSDELRAVTAQNGVLYVADQDEVFAYLPEEDALIPATGLSDQLADIRQIAASRNQLYVLNSNHLEIVQRTMPIDVTLEATPEFSQTALLELVLYLESRDLLDWRTELARFSYQSLEAFLLDRKAFIVPLDQYARQKTRSGFARLFSTNRSRQDEIPVFQLLDFADLFCAYNADFCGDTPVEEIFALPVAAATTVVIPDLKIRNYLLRGTVEADGKSVDELVEDRIFSEDLRVKVSEDLINRLNSRSSSSSRGSRRNGAIEIPYEAWSVTVSVPRADYEGQSEDLWRLMRFEGVGIYGREAFATKTAFSTPIADGTGADSGGASTGVDEGDADALCTRLKINHDLWLQAIQYPTEYTPIQEAGVAVGIVENEGQTDRSHHVFHIDEANPAWYEPVDLELVAETIPLNASSKNESLIDIDTYSEAAHGTHVSAIVGGRKGDCWSGLLPRSKLVFIDIADQGELRRQILGARTVDTRVFNISQDIGQNSTTVIAGLRRMIQEFDDSLFIAAAGNRGQDLNPGIGVPSPARFGSFANVITVTASTREAPLLRDYLIEGHREPGANFGKKFVDLAALGSKVKSATAPQRFGDGTGTSFAAPTVAAAAAYLTDPVEGLGESPGDTKARLIATAEWASSLNGFVWGGLLNFRDAVRFPDRNLIQTETGGDKVYSVDWRRSRAVRVTNQPRLYERETLEERDAAVAPDKIAWDGILSLRKNGDGTHRVVYREAESNELRIILNAALEGTVECRTRSQLLASQEFEDGANECDSPIRMDQIRTYFRRMPYGIDW